jgi:hypothetical protein
VEGLRCLVMLVKCAPEEDGTERMGVFKKEGMNSTAKLEVEQWV